MDETPLDICQRAPARP